MNKLKELVSDFIGLALAIILLFHLIMIQIYNSVMIYENNEWILITELVMAVVIIVLKIDRIIDDIKIAKTFIVSKIKR